jgi:hypothetical protein
MTTTRPAIEYHYKCHCGVIHYGVRYHAWFVCLNCCRKVRVRGA